MPAATTTVRKLTAGDLAEGMQVLDHVGRLFVIAAVERRDDGRVRVTSDQPRRWGSYASADQFVLIDPSAPPVTLHKTAPWNPRLRNGYRERYATAHGRFYKVYAEWLNAPWWVEQIDADGETISGEDHYPVFMTGAQTLADARAVIAADEARPPGANEVR